MNTRFSVIIDETTDVSTHKELAVVTRFYDKQSMSIKCPLYELLEVSHGDAETLSRALLSVIERNGIPPDNVIGFAADTTNVMLGSITV